MRRMAHLLTMNDTAEHLGLSTEDVERLVNSGSLRIVPASTENSVHIADLQAFQASRMKPSTLVPVRREEVLTDQL